eukprot:1153706-Pelagomonas_calceolata.AAC.1
MATAEVMQQQEPLGVQVAGLQFSYPGQAGPPGEPFIRGCNIDIPRGSRCLLVGANGAGKTTLLQKLAYDSQTVLSCRAATQVVALLLYTGPCWKVHGEPRPSANIGTSTIPCGFILRA